MDGSSSTATTLSTALTEFRVSLSDERKACLLALRSVLRATKVLPFTAELDCANAARKHRGVASRFCMLLESIQPFAAVMDAYSQAKVNLTSLISGSLKLRIQDSSTGAASTSLLTNFLYALAFPGVPEKL